MERHHMRAMVGVALVLFAACRVQAQMTWYSNIGNPLAYNVIEPSVLYDSAAGYFTMWYVNPAYGTPAYGIMKAVSSDGVTWFYGGNLLLAVGEPGAFDHYIHSVNVVRNGGKYLMYYTASQSGDSLCIGLATSEDGDHWQKSPSSPVLIHGQAPAWDARDVGGAKVCLANGMFMMWYGGYYQGHGSTGLATSVDGITWTKDNRNPVLRYGNPGEADAMEAGVMGLTSRDTYYMIYRSINGSGTQSFSLATSADGANWTKYYGNPVRQGSWWDGYELGGGTLLWQNGLFRLWYAGSAGGTWGLGEAVSEPDPLQVKETAAGAVPTVLQLEQNYPNPCNPTTKIQFTIVNRLLTIVKVFDVLGREVTTLVNEVKEPGTYSVQFDGSNLASGVYFYRLQAGDFVSTKRMLVIK